MNAVQAADQVEVERTAGGWVVVDSALFNYHLNHTSVRNGKCLGLMFPFSSQHLLWVFSLVTEVGGRLRQWTLAGKWLSRAGLGEGAVEDSLLPGLDWAGDGPTRGSGTSCEAPPSPKGVSV